MPLRLTIGSALIAILLTSTFSAPANADAFAGSLSCASCHSQQQQNWMGSDHQLAMQHATAKTVLGDFNETVLTANGITSRFFTRDGKYYVNTDGADGSMQDFEIRYTFGLRPLQQYLVEFPDGRVQTLRQAWDTRPKSAGGQRWFHLYPDETISSGDLLHWTGGQQNWNYMCADCHSTNLKKNYDIETDTFATSWSEINVGCESCHGPGQNHITWAGLDESLKKDDPKMGLSNIQRDRQNVHWTIDPVSGNAVRSEPPGGDHEFETCAACHSRRGQLGEGVEVSGSFLDYYRPSLLTQGLYHTDGQILDEVYVWGSFAQSKMKMAGVTCSDCHDPHSLQLRAEQQMVCAQCHSWPKYAATTHHGHQPESKGANCLDCHMPETTYMVVDPRRDHSLRIPRPDLSLEFDTPNACNQCHIDKDTQWAANEFNRMWPEVSEPFQTWTRAYSMARAGAPQAELSLINIIRDKNTPDIARATAINELRPFLSPLSGQVVQVALADKSALVRFAALTILDALPPESRYQFAAPLLNDPVLMVRSEAARIAAPGLRGNLSPQENATLKKAIQEYVDTQMQNAERPESHLNLGNMYVGSGDTISAEKAYRRAIKLDRKFGPAYTNLADLYRIQSMDKAAEQVLTEGISVLPNNATLHHAQGLLLARNQQMDAALISLKTAAELQPEVPRNAYVYGVALNSTGNSAEAMKVLKQSFQTNPRDRETIFMIASIYRDQGNIAEARDWAQKLLDINPADQNATQFIASLNTTGQ